MNRRMVMMRKATYCSLLMLIALVVISGAMTVPKSVQATFPGANGRIAFVSYRGWWSPPCTTTNVAPWSPDAEKLPPDSHGVCDSVLITMNPDGTDVREVFSALGVLTTPAWSPDGNGIALSVWDGELGTSSIHLLNTNGSVRAELDRKLTSGLEDSDPTWSPDGRNIAFDRWDPSVDTASRWIYEVNADGTGLIRITKGADPSWSPDGKRIAFDGPQGPGGPVAIMNADGTGSHSLSFGNGVMPDWSPDGQKVVFSNFRDGQIYVINADGTGLTQLTTTGQNEFPSWSPDGQMIVFTSNRDGVLPPDLGGDAQNPRFTWNIYVMNADGSGQHSLTGSRAYRCCADFFPTWQRIAIPATSTSVGTTSSTIIVEPPNPPSLPSWTTLLVISSVIAFPVLTVSIVATGRMRRPPTYHPRRSTTSWGSIAAITGGGMLLVASLWQLEIVEISRATSECSYYWPFDVGGPTCWWLARDFWFAGVFAAFVLALIGAWRYAGFTRILPARQVESYRTALEQPWPALTADERLYNYITQHGGTISLSTASNDLGMSMADINASISRLKQARRIE